MTTGVTVTETEGRGTEGRTRHVHAATDPDNELRPHLTAPFRAGDWWCGSNGKILVAYPLEAGDPQDEWPEEHRKVTEERIPNWLAWEAEEPVSTTVEALRAWAGPPPSADDEDPSPYAYMPDRFGVLCGVPVNRRLLAHMLEHAPGGSIDLHPNAPVIRGENHSAILLRAPIWRGVIAGLREVFVDRAAVESFEGVGS